MAINTLFENIADAIREASSSTEDYTPAEMPDAIRAISTSGGGDMYKADYDPDNIVDDAGGIVDYVAAQIAGKANSADVYTKTEADNLLSSKANSADVYTKTEADNLLSSKANSANVYTKTEADNLLSSKANSADVYTKTATDDLLDTKTNISTITDLFDANTSYAAGDYFIDNNIIYHVDVPCTGITPPNANYYTPNKLTDFIKENTSQISNLSKYNTELYYGYGTSNSNGNLLVTMNSEIPTSSFPIGVISATAGVITLLMYKNTSDLRQFYIKCLNWDMSVKANATVEFYVSFASYKSNDLTTVEL